MSEFIQLEAKKRDLIGKKVRQIRRAGMVPAVVYGPEADPLHLAIDQGDLRAVLVEAGGTQLIELNMEDEKIPTLAREVQRDPVRGDMLHVDFYRVSMTRPISAEVPVILINESPLVTSGAAVLVQPFSSLLVEALPADLPPQVEVDMTELTEIGDQLLVGDLNLPEGTKALTDEAELVVKLDYPRTIEEEEEEEEDLLFEDESVEPEVITERKDEDEEEEFEE